MISGLAWLTSAPAKARTLRLGDLAVLVVVAIVGIVAVAAGSTYLDRPLGWVDLVGALVAVVLLVLSSTRPLVALLAGIAATAVTIAATGERAVLLAAVVLLLFRVASRCERRTTLCGLATALVVLYGVSLLVLPDVGFERDLDVAAWSVLAVAAGDAVRSRRAYLRELEERARQAERSREEDARRRVVEERLRIARDLHDLVAHRMAVINVQAGVAAHQLRSAPDDAEQALRVVRSSVSEVLGELGEILSVLRNVDDPAAPVEPAPTLRDLGPLVESFASAGLDVAWTSVGALDDIADSTQLVVYRLVQEGLTNAHRHGDGRASLRIERSDAVVSVMIANAIGGTGAGDEGRGFGLLGMRERVAAVGGTITAGPTGDGWFRVNAAIATPGRRST